MEVGLGSYLSVMKDSTFVTGIINGIKLKDGELERVSFECIDIWFYMSDGWAFVEQEQQEEGEEDGEV